MGFTHPFVIPTLRACEIGNLLDGGNLFQTILMALKGTDITAIGASLSVLISTNTRNIPGLKGWDKKIELMIFLKHQLYCPVIIIGQPKTLSFLNNHLLNITSQSLNRKLFKETYL